MTKKLVFVTTMLLFLLSFGVADAKVCRTGDPECTSSDLLSGGNSGCDLSVYKSCDVPKVGAVHCLVGDEDSKEAYYKEEDCCSNEGLYRE